MAFDTSIRTVVVTGRGVLLPVGTGRDALARWLGGEPMPPTIADFRAADYITNPKVLRSMQRAFQLSAAAAVLAMREARLPTADSLTHAGIDAARAGTAVSMAEISPLTPDLLRVLHDTAIDGQLDLSRFAEVAMHRLHPFRRLSLLVNLAAAHVSLLFGLQGPSFTFNAGDSAGGHALAEAFWTIAEGRADLMICEAADVPELAAQPERVLECAGAIVVEDAASAMRRGAPVWAELRPVARRSRSHTAWSSIHHTSVGRPRPHAASGLLSMLASLFDLSADNAPPLPVGIAPREEAPLATASL